jgi:dihydroflavonol-4-reductase
MSGSVFITGATGFIGSHILRALLANGYRNITALRQGANSSHLIRDIEDSVQWIYGDLDDIDVLESGCEQADVVIHAAALISMDRRHRRRLFDVNVQGTAQMVNSALRAGIRKFVHISSITAVSESPRDLVVDEETEWKKGRMTTLYGLTKHLAEMEVWRGVGEGLHAVILNPSVVLGPGQWGKGTGLIFRSIDRASLFYPPGETGFVDVRDVAEIAVRAVNTTLNGSSRFIISGTNTSYREVYEAIALKLGKRPPRYKITNFLRTLIRLGLPMIRLLNPGSSLGSDAFKPIFLKHEYDASRSESMFGFRYRPLEETLHYTCQSYLESTKRGISGTSVA